MLPVEALHSVRVLVVHDECPDGLASAILLKDALPDAELRFLQYGTEAHESLTPQPGLLFCDFSPHPRRTREFADIGTIVLDHHRTARSVVEAMGTRGVYGDETREPGVSGAMLAYQHVWEPLRGRTPCAAFARHFAMLAGIRDTWQRHQPEWDEACAQAQVLTVLPRRWWLQQTLAQIARSWPEELSRMGALLLEREQERLQDALLAAHRFTTPRGERVVALNGASLASDACEVLGDHVELVVGFDCLGGHRGPRLQVSLRSHAGFDCAEFARSRGGGGHARAAGLALPLSVMDPQPFALIERLFRNGSG